MDYEILSIKNSLFGVIKIKLNFLMESFVIILIYFSAFVSFVCLIMIIKIKDKIDDFNLKLDYIENKLDK